MIFVTVGTHEDPFDRLVQAAERLAQQTGERVVVQAGPSTVPTPTCERFAWCTPDELAQHIKTARAVVLHGGPSTLHEVLDAGVLPVVVPRDPARGEHVDDHQLRSSAQLPKGVPVFRDTEALIQWFVADDLPDAPTQRRSAAQTLEVCRRLDAVLRDISPPPVSERGPLQAILHTLFRRIPHGS